MKKYSKVSCHTKKADAKKVQKKMHAKGLTAQIKKDPKTGKQCIYSKGKRKK